MAARTYTVHTGRLPDGTELLVERWPDGHVTAATRSDAGESWGPPIELTSERVAVAS